MKGKRDARAPVRVTASSVSGVIAAGFGAAAVRGGILSASPAELKRDTSLRLVSRDVFVLLQKLER